MENYYSTSTKENFNSVATYDPYSGLDKIYNAPQMGIDYGYNDILYSYVTGGVDQCANLCYNNNNCVGFVTNAAGNQCWLKSAMGKSNYNPNRNSYTINRNNSYTDYIQYDNLLLNDGSNVQELTNVPSECITSCINNPNCRGLNIVLNTGQNEVSTDGYNYQNVPKVTCEYVSNICYSNAKSENPNSKFFAKKHNLHFENNTPYLLKNNGVCLSAQSDTKGNTTLIGVNCNDSSKVSPVLFNTTADTIQVGTDSGACLSYTSDTGLKLLKCNIWDQNQKFIYDHVYNTLRPISDTTKCITTTKTTQNDGSPLYTFGIGACGNPSPSNNTTFENYYRPDPEEDYIEYFENDYSVDMGYYIIYMILLLMIAYLVIASSSKK
jgi:hypothetical protein